MELLVVLNQRLPPVFVRLFVVLLSTIGVKCLTLSLDRATARTLLFDVTSDSPCNELIWEYKSSINNSWGPPPSKRENAYNPCAYYIKNLESDMLHYVRVRQGTNGTYSNEISAWTCREKLSTVKMFVADTGPGWIDVRWEVPKEKCSGRYYYNVRYKSSANASYTAEKTFGYFLVRKSQAYVGPLHPCENPKKEFCVLLTDNVEPGQNHTIELQMKRIGGEMGEKSEKQWVQAYADPEHLQPAGDVPCKVSEGGTVITVPLWLAALLGCIYFLALVAIFGLWVKFRFLKVNNEEKKLDRSNSTPYYSKEERYVNPSDMRSSTIGKKVDECEEEIYEEICIPQSPELSWKFTSVEYKRDVCR